MAKREMTRECIFHNGDYHFEMIILPYVNNFVKEGKEVIVFTENDLEETMKVLLNRVNFKEEDRNKILNINWNKNDSEKLTNISNKQNLSIYVKGSRNYINSMNSKISEIIKDGKQCELDIIDCYEFDEVKDDIPNIAKSYSNTVKTVKM